MSRPPRRPGLSRLALVACLASVSACGSGNDASSGQADGGAPPAGGSLCDQATRHVQASCPDYLWTASFGACEGDDRCRAGCVLEHPCSIEEQNECSNRLCFGPAARDAGLPNDRTDSGGDHTDSWTPGAGSDAEDAGLPAGLDASSGGGSGGGSSDASSGGGGVQPECIAYAKTYCGCLGSIAAPDCFENQRDNCDFHWDYLCGYRIWAQCVVSESCAKGWVDRCGDPAQIDC